MKNRPLVLASTSVYRRELLIRLQLPFQILAPRADEAALPGEQPSATAARLAATKASSVRHLYETALIIGSDQVAELDGQALSKPGDHANAARQLRALRGRSVRFHTALALLDAASGRLQQHIDVTEVKFRALSDAQIESYLRRERPYDSAGSAKAESLGIALTESIRSADPTALIGLPLIALTTLLQNEAVQIL